MVPHLETTAASSSGDSAGPAFIVGLLGVDVKRGSNRGNDKKSHCSCHGGGTSLAFIVGLLDVGNKSGSNRGNKRGSNRGNRATSQGCSKVPLSLSRWQGGSGGGAGPVVVGLLGVQVKNKRGSQQQGAHSRNFPAINTCESVGDCIYSSKPFRPDLGQSKRCLNPV